MILSEREIQEVRKQSEKIVGDTNGRYVSRVVLLKRGDVLHSMVFMNTIGFNVTEVSGYHGIGVAVTSATVFIDRTAHPYINDEDDKAMTSAALKAVHRWANVSEFADIAPYVLEKYKGKNAPLYSVLKELNTIFLRNSYNNVVKVMKDGTLLNGVPVQGYIENKFGLRHCITKEYTYFCYQV